MKHEIMKRTRMRTKQLQLVSSVKSIVQCLARPSTISYCLILCFAICYSVLATICYLLLRVFAIYNLHALCSITSDHARSLIMPSRKTDRTKLRTKPGIWHMLHRAYNLGPRTQGLEPRGPQVPRPQYFPSRSYCGGGRRIITQDLEESKRGSLYN